MRGGTPTTIRTRTAFGQWPILDFDGADGGGGGGGATSCDCVVTYTCKYNMGWDECDNQRWGVDNVLGGQTEIPLDAFILIAD